MDFSELVELAEVGDAEAQYKVGRCYEQGKGVEKDKLLAFKWYKKAGKQKSFKAMYRVGLMYLKGEGTKADKESGLKILSYLASNKYGKASYFLARCYEKGKYVEKNEVEARKYYWGALLAKYRVKEMEEKLEVESFELSDFIKELQRKGKS